MILSSLGISTYAVREVSRLKSDEYNQIHCTMEILGLHMILTIGAYIAVGLMYFFVPRINANGDIFLIMSIPIIFNVIGAVWFFQAREDFKFILVRSLVVKVISLASLFMFVRDSGDVVAYAVILAFADAFNNLLNFMRLRKIIKSRRVSFSGMRFIRHLRPTVTIFAMSFVISLYIDLPPIFLGFVSGDDSVGYYVTASKLTKVILTMVTALGTTLLPRMSHYFASGNMVKFRELEQTGLQFVIGVTLPVSVALMVIAPEVIVCFTGVEFEPSINVLRIISPTIMIIGIAGIVGFQSLYPQGKESVIIASAIAGFVLSTILNIVLTPSMSQDGAAVAYLVAELTVTLSMIVFGRKYIKSRYVNKSVMIYIISTVAMAMVLMLIHTMVDVRMVFKFAIEVVTGLAIYIALLFVMKEPLFIRLSGNVIQGLAGRLSFGANNN